MIATSDDVPLLQSLVRPLTTLAAISSLIWGLGIVNFVVTCRKRRSLWGNIASPE